MTKGDSSAEDVPRIRGVPILSFLTAVRMLAGYDAVNRMMGRLPEDLRDALRYRRIVESAWYPLSWYTAMHAAAQEATGMGRGLARMIGRATTRSDFSGVNRVFLLVLSPQALIAKAPRVYEQYFTMGSVSAPEASRGSARLLWQGCAGFDRNLWDDVLGTAEALVELAGGRDVQIDVVSGAGEDDTDAEMIIRWT